MLYLDEVKSERKETVSRDQLKVSILIPCHNEEKSIRQCVLSCLNQSRPVEEVVVVNDGSTDKSGEILYEFGNKIKLVDLKQNSGNKSYAQEIGLRFITGEIFIATDADTILDKNFIKEIVKSFENKETAAACGYVKSLKHNWLTACREIDYAVGQGIHKYAQSIINFLIVIPGCAAAFRTDIFRTYITFDHDTVAEDMDFTYKLNKRGKRIVYNEKAIVYTQDPADLHSYIYQMKRWYGGGWQNLKKHYSIVGKKTAAALEISMAYIEGLFFPFLFILIPILNYNQSIRFAALYLANAFVLSTYAAFRSRRLDLIMYAPLYVFILGLNSGIFIFEFIREVILKRRNLVWFHAVKREIV